MLEPRQSIGRRHFLASTIIGTIAAGLPQSAAHAVTTPPPAPGASTLAPGQPVSASVGAAGGDTSNIGAAASCEPVNEPSIRPFHYQATDAELAELKRRILATRWPEKE